MITYKFHPASEYLQKIVDGIETGEWHHPTLSQEYLKWLEEGNVPLSADE